MRKFILTNFVGQHIRQVRLLKKLSLRDVAIMIGYRNLSKGMNRIKQLEETGQCHPDLLEKLIVALAIDPVTINDLRQREKEEIEAWLDAPVPVKLTVRYFGGCYVTETLPATWSRQQMIACAMQKSRRMRRYTLILRLDRRRWVWIEPSGQYRIDCYQSPL